MGSGMRKAVFTDTVVLGLKHWHNLARNNLSKNRFTSVEHSSDSCTIDTTEISIASVQKSHLLCYEHFPHSTSTCSPEITEAAVQNNTIPKLAETSFSTPEINEEEANPKVITRGTYDGEISFGSSWKKVDCRRVIQSIASIIEENASDAITVVNEWSVVAL